MYAILLVLGLFLSIIGSMLTFGPLVSTSSVEEDRDKKGGAFSFLVGLVLFIGGTALWIFGTVNC